MHKKKILIICNSNLSREPRVIRQIVALKEEYVIQTLGLISPGIEGVEHFNLNLNEARSSHLSYPLVFRKTYSAAIKIFNGLKEFYLKYYFEKDYWTNKRKLIVKDFKKKKYDVIIAHHWDTLPMAVEIAGSSTRLIFNAHDYYTKEFENNKLWAAYTQRMVTYIMSKYVPKFDHVFAAWNKIKIDYTEQYKVPAVVINNATEFNDLFPVIKNENENIKIIHHGIANSDRQIEKMIEVIDHLDERFTLDLMLVYNDHEKEYFNFLKEKALLNKRIHFIDPVPTREIAKRINGYDIGLFLLPLNGFNPTYTLPNKLFEFVQARIACLVTPNIEMKNIVEKYDLGWISTEFEPSSIAEKIENITHSEITAKKMNAHKNAKELSAERNYILIKEKVDEVLSGKDDEREVSQEIKLKKSN